jgi:pimeloyl-ACP methyl ester carboxylesterase
MFREDRIQLGSVVCNRARTSTPGAPLVMLHGVTRSWRTFLPLMPALSVHGPILTFDFRGHGRSSRAAGHYRVVDYAREAIRFLLDQVEPPAVVYGHSLGAMVAAAVAAEASEAVRAVILEDPPFETMGGRIHRTRLHSYFSAMRELAGSRRPLAELSRAVAALPLIDPESGDVTRLAETRDAASLRFTAKCLTQLDPEVLTPIVAGRWLNEYDQSGILRHVCCPTLLLQADPTAGGMLTDDDAAEVEALVADCARVRLTGAGHMLHGSRTQEIVNAVHNFLESLEEPETRSLPRNSSQEPAHEDF